LKLEINKNRPVENSFVHFNNLLLNFPLIVAKVNNYRDRYPINIIYLELNKDVHDTVDALIILKGGWTQL